MGTFRLWKGRDNQFYWSLKAANGQILCHSEGYTSKQAALSGIESCKQNALTARLADETSAYA